MVSVVSCLAWSGVTCGQYQVSCVVRRRVCSVARVSRFRCPYTGCGNTTPLKMDHLEENTQLKAYIAEQKQKAESEKT